MPTFVEVESQNTELLCGSSKGIPRFKGVLLEEIIGKTVIGVTVGETEGNYGEMGCYRLLFSDGTSVGFEFEND